MKRASILSVGVIIITQYVVAQNVGVGTNTPVEKLHVAGNLKADTIKPTAIKFVPNAGNGKLLISDAEGNASWQNFTVNSGGGNGVGFGSWGDCLTNANIGGYNPVSHPDASGGDLFGRSVSIDGEFAIIGSLSDNVNGNNDQGSAFIFRFDGNKWSFFQQLNDPTGMADDHFGSSVSISGNIAVIGVPGADIGSDVDQGAASVFQFDGVNWVFIQQLTDPTGAPDEDFGRSVSIYGSTIIVGAPFDAVTLLTQGSASVFQYDGSNWVFIQQLTDPGASEDDWFGRSVAINGDNIIVGAPHVDIGINTNQGAVFIFHFDGSSWNFIQELTDPSGANDDELGASVSISGTFAAAGAKLDNGVGTNLGSAHTFFNDEGTWEWNWSFTEPNPVNNDNFGASVFVSGNFLIIGANQDDVTHTNQGTATIYQRVGLGWQRLQQVVDPGATINSDLGYGTAIDGNSGRFLIGAPGFIGNSGRAVFGKIN